MVFWADTAEYPTAAERSYVGKKELRALSPQEAGSLLARYTPADFAAAQSALQSQYQLDKWAIGVWNESLYYAIYQALVAPWLQLPAVLHIIQKVSNAISCLPCGIKNRRTGKTDELPAVLRMPLGADNPSFHAAQMWEDICMSLFKTGCAAAVVTTGSKGRTLRVATVDTIRMQVCGTFISPYFHLSAGTISGLKSYSGPDPRKDQVVGDIFPNGSPTSPHKMLYMAWMRSPETLRGIPAGLMAANTILAATSTEEYTSEYYGDWQQLLISPRNRDDMANAQSTLDSIADQIDNNDTVVLAATEMMVEQLGLSARESEIVAARVADQGFLASIHGADASLVSNQASSFAQLYASRQMLRTDIIDPILNMIEAEFSRVCPPGWDLWFDRSALDRGDPKTMTDLAAIKVEKGIWSVNRALKYMGDEMIGDPEDMKNPYNRVTVNGNRVFLDMLEERLEQQKPSDKISDDSGRPDENKTPPSPDYPSPPESEM